MVRVEHVQRFKLIGRYRVCLHYARYGAQLQSFRIVGTVSSIIVLLGIWVLFLVTFHIPYLLRIALQALEISCPAITHGEIIKDRKSSFQGHAAEVHSIDDINAVLANLMRNRKIHDATHNILAYRVELKTEGNVRMLEDCDDDGEANAGGRLLRLLQMLDQRSTLVVVSRWFGGIQLGPDRFRHINEAAKQAIEKAGLIKK